MLVTSLDVIMNYSGHQHDVCVQPDHGHRSGALRLPSPAQPQHHLRDRDQPEEDAAG